MCSVDAKLFLLRKALTLEAAGFQVVMDKKTILRSKLYSLMRFNAKRIFGKKRLILGNADFQHKLEQNKVFKSKFLKAI